MNSSEYPKITVVTPSFNQGRFLETCIRSVLEQEYPHVEYIIIDGGSTDNSVSIIKKYASRLAYWVSEPDAGQSEAINKGWSHATGDLVAWLNADDFYLPGAFQAVAAAYRQHPDASFYFGDGFRVDESGKPTRSFFPEGTHFFNREALLFGLNYIMQQATFINRRILASIGGLNPKLHYGMDTDLWIRLSAVAPPVPVPAKLAAIREYPDTKTGRGAFERVEELRSIAESHTGMAMTPGVLLYFLDTLHRYAQAHPNVYTMEYLAAIRQFWRATGKLLRNMGARPDGFPDPGALKERRHKTWLHRLFPQK